MKVIVLCGGLGTRLGDLTKELPKPILPVGGRPFIEYVLDQISSAPIEEIILAVGFQWRKIKSLIGSSWRGVPVSYSVEEQLLGTGGAIKFAIGTAKNQDVLVVNGDTFLKINPNDLKIFADEHGADMVIALKGMQDCSRYGIVSTDSASRIISFGEKQSSRAGYINSGMYYMRTSLLEHIEKKQFSFENDFLLPMHKKYMCFGLKTDAYFIDMGVPGDYLRAQTEMLAQ